MGTGGGGRIARTAWSGAISFGLVNIPIKLVTATKDRDIHFHMLHEEDSARIRFKRVCPEHGREVPNEEIVRGYEVSPGHYVTFTDEELENADPKASRTIDIEDFVGLEEIDPAYYNKPYYVIPDKNADKPYALLLEALKRSKKVGIARMVLRDKEHLVAIRAKEKVLVMETMHFADEVVAPETVAPDLPKAQAADRKQVDLAEKLIESLTSPFDPAKYRNTHRERVLELIDQKAEGKEVVVEPEAKPVARTTDLLAALERSLVAVKARGGSTVMREPAAHATHAKHGKKAHSAVTKAKGKGKAAA